MECLQAKDKKQRRILSHKGGSEVLRLTYPTVTGETAAATHTLALINALADFGEGEAARIAAEALLTAVQNGRLFDFTCHTYDISLNITHHKTCTEVTLAVILCNGDSPILSHTKTMYWDSSESIQLQKAPREVRSRHKREKSRDKIKNFTHTIA